MRTANQTSSLTVLVAMTILMMAPGGHAQNLAYDAENGLDAWDKRDDAPKGATEIKYVTITERGHGPHVVGGNDAADWYVFPNLSADTIYDFNTRDSKGGTIRGEIFWSNNLGHPIISASNMSTDIITTGSCFWLSTLPGTYYLKLTANDRATTVSYTLRTHMAAQ
ncbi:hypothetical protein GX645_00490 [Candidatus Sumerlaeota bacterium]|nr:hypothetical protein [Candidatus Sumerlaeales bacterium]NLD60918.1 hypothetical protein [Candidatus Sumerlaeota bacterium]